MIYIVMGGQAGSEGKGEFVAYLAQKLSKEGELRAVVRTGGPNAGHTMTTEFGVHKMRQIPCAWHLTPRVSLFIAHGSLIDPKVFQAELEMIRGVRGDGEDDLPFIEVDRHVNIIKDHHKDREAHLRDKVGSTTEGIGAARADHVMRSAGLAGRMTNLGFPPKMYRNLFTDVDVAARLNSIADSHGDIIIESTQGFDLSLNLSGHYPQTTSRDVTPGQILNDCGLSSRLPHRVISVVRTHPIRVAGNSGFMAHETDWETLKEDSGGYISEPETTTVTGNVRRIGYYDKDQIHRMGEVCRPDWIALTFLDYLDPRCAGMQGQELDDYFHWSNDKDGNEMDTVPGDLLVKKTVGFVDQVERDSGSRIGWISTGPGVITSFDNAKEPGSSAGWGFTPDISVESAEAQKS